MQACQGEAACAWEAVLTEGCSGLGPAPAGAFILMFTLMFTLSSRFESPVLYSCKGAAGGVLSVTGQGCGVRGPCAGAACLLRAPPSSESC
eukprot:5687695-Prymnesium_polylepis.1